MPGHQSKQVRHGEEVVDLGLTHIYMYMCIFINAYLYKLQNL